jgi:DNA polymerase-3 subunit gamma/tau
MDVVRERWPNVLDAVRTERRLAWIQLGSATVQSLEGGVLTVGFASEGMAKGFSASGCDQVLAGALNSVLGVNVRVKAVVAAEAAVPSARASSVATGTPHVTPGRSPAAAEPARESPAGPPSAGSPSAGSPGQGPQGQGPQGHSDAAPPAAGEGSRRGAAPGEDAPQAGGQVSEPRAEEPGQQPAPGGQGAASAGGGAKEEAVRAATSGRRAARRPAAASGGGNAAKQARSRQPSESQGGAGYADEEWPDDAGGPGNAGAGPDALTGMELIQRQLGGRVIEEIDEA